MISYHLAYRALYTELRMWASSTQLKQKNDNTGLVFHDYIDPTTMLLIVINGPIFKVYANDLNSQRFLQMLVSCSDYNKCCEARLSVTNLAMVCKFDNQEMIMFYIDLSYNNNNHSNDNNGNNGNNGNKNGSQQAVPNLCAVSIDLSRWNNELLKTKIEPNSGPIFLHLDSGEQQHHPKNGSGTVN